MLFLSNCTENQLAKEVWAPLAWFGDLSNPKNQPKSVSTTINNHKKKIIIGWTEHPYLFIVKPNRCHLKIYVAILPIFTPKIIGFFSLLFSLYQTDIKLHQLLKVVNHKRIWISSGLPAKLFLCIFHLQVQFYHFLWHQKILLWTKYLHFHLSKKLIMLGFCFKLEQMINLDYKLLFAENITSCSGLQLYNTIPEGILIVKSPDGRTSRIGGV